MNLKINSHFSLLSLGICCFLFCQSAKAVENIGLPPPGYWHDLRSPLYVWPDDSAIYYMVRALNGSKVHLIVVDTKTNKWSIEPALNDSTTGTSQTAIRQHASAAVNGGYFNLSDGISASYVVVNRGLVADPRTNKALSDNPKLKPYLEIIYNRSEVRFLRNHQGQLNIQIANHNDPLPEKNELIHSLQGGPRLLPELTTKKEAFIRRDPDGRDFDAIGSSKPAARTAFGITPDGYAMLACVSGKDQDSTSPGLTLEALAELLKQLGCSEALNLDGGASSSMFVRLRDSANTDSSLSSQGQTVSGKTPETLVKSVLLLKHTTN